MFTIFNLSSLLSALSIHKNYCHFNPTKKSSNRMVLPEQGNLGDCDENKKYSEMSRCRCIGRGIYV